jgi:hypothetical protein
MPWGAQRSPTPESPAGSDERCFKANQRDRHEDFDRTLPLQIVNKLVFGQGVNASLKPFTLLESARGSERFQVERIRPLCHLSRVYAA